MTSSTDTEPTAPVRKAFRLVPVGVLIVAAALNFLVAVMDRGPHPAFNAFAGVALTIGALAFAGAAYRDLTGRRPRG
jgi:hypothetical protein